MAEAASHEKGYSVCKNPGNDNLKSGTGVAEKVWRKAWVKQFCSTSECFIAGKTPLTSTGLLWELVVILGYCGNTNTIVPW